MIKDKYFGFKRFCSILSDENILKRTTASSVSEDLKLCLQAIKSDVLSKLLELEENKRNIYLDLSINKINSQNFNSDIGIDHVQNYLDIYNVTVNQILNQEYNDAFSKLFDYLIDYNDYSKSSLEMRYLQMRFLEYFCSHYANELIGFLDSKKITSSIIRTKFNSVVHFYSKIFESEESQDWFVNALQKLNAIDSENKAIRGFQAKCEAIFTNSVCKKLIFKYGLSKTEFIKYLNENFEVIIKAKDKLSPGGNHEEEVSNLIEIFINELPPNKAE